MQICWYIGIKFHEKDKKLNILKFILEIIVSILLRMKIKQDAHLTYEETSNEINASNMKNLSVWVGVIFHRTRKNKKFFENHLIWQI